MSPERSVRQLVCVFTDRLSYAPAMVKISAYTHTIPTERRTANRLSMGWFDFIIDGIYCNKLQTTLAPRKRNKNLEVRLSENMSSKKLKLLRVSYSLCISYALFSLQI